MKFVTEFLHPTLNQTLRPKLCTILLVSLDLLIGLVKILALLGGFRVQGIISVSMFHSIRFSII